MENKKYKIDEVIDEYENSLLEQPKLGELKGKIVRFQVADSYAYYIVTDENKNTAYLDKLQISNFDNYTEPILGEKGEMPINRLVSHINLDYRLHMLFRKNKLV